MIANPGAKANPSAWKWNQATFHQCSWDCFAS